MTFTQGLTLWRVRFCSCLCVSPRGRGARARPSEWGARRQDRLEFHFPTARHADFLCPPGLGKEGLGASTGKRGGQEHPTASPSSSRRAGVGSHPRPESLSWLWEVERPGPFSTRTEGSPAAMWKGQLEGVARPRRCPERCWDGSRSQGQARRTAPVGQGQLSRVQEEAWPRSPAFAGAQASWVVMATAVGTSWPGPASSFQPDGGQSSSWTELHNLERWFQSRNR